MKMVDLKEDYRKIEDGIDLEQLLNQQGVMQFDSGKQDFIIKITANVL